MPFELTDYQAHVRDEASSDKYIGDPVAITGYAGTGKTVTTAETIKAILAKSPTSTIVVLAPTAAALSVIENKLSAFAHRIVFKTVASVTQTPMETVTIGDNFKKFDLNAHGLMQLGSFLNRLGIDRTGLATVTGAKDRFTRNVDLDAVNEAFGSLRGQTGYVSLNTAELSSRLLARFKGHKKMAMCETKQESYLLSPAECANRIDPGHEKAGTKPTAAIIVDEFSMVNDDVAEVLSLAAAIIETRFIVCGDPGQLSPVEGAPNRLLSAHNNTAAARFELTEILRSDDCVAELAAKIRNGVPVRNLVHSGQAIDCSYKSIGEVIAQNFDVFKNAGAVVTFKNRNVDEFNKLLRAIHGHKGSYQVGDRLVCNQNTYGAFHGRFRNGELLTVTAVGYDSPAIAHDIDAIKHQATLHPRSELAVVAGHIEAGNLVGVEVTNRMGEHKTAFAWSHDCKLHKSARDLHVKLINNDDELTVSPIISTSFAYALTVHKAQGSEWENVVYYTTQGDLNLQKTFNAPYTAVTRAKKNITIFYDSSQR